MQEAGVEDAIAELDAKLAYIQLLLGRMEQLAQRVADGGCDAAQRMRFQVQFNRLREDIDRVADSLPRQIER